MMSDLRHRLVAGRSLAPLEVLGYPWHTSSEFKPRVEGMLAGRWEKAGCLVTDMRPPINFDGHARPHACDLHSWEPVGYALHAFDTFNDQRYLDLSLGYVFDWLDRYWLPVAHSTAPDHLDGLIADNATFAWYDMAVGRRIFRLAYILDVVSRDPASSDERLRHLWDALQFHHAVLARDHFFRAHSNHGIHQALGQLAAAWRFFHMPDTAAQYALARERSLQVLDAHFTSEGAHREHSPGYHYGLMVTFIGAAASGLLQDRQLAGRIAAMEDVLSWMITPALRLAALGDTDPKLMVRSIPFVSQLSNASLQFQMSNGKLGLEPPCGVKALAESGYVFARLQGGRGPAYLAQTAAFHSAVHKHADHLSFVWYDGGSDILVDSGRYAYLGRTEAGSELFDQGFWYSDPKRIYVESTRAHNCVELDDRSYPRRNVRRWGSALRYAGEQDGCLVTDCEVTHFRYVRHRRVLVMFPGRFLFVLDFLNDRTSVHDYRQWFQFAPEWDVGTLKDGRGAVARHKGGASLAITSLIPDTGVMAPIRGQEAPRLQGWTSDTANSLIPCTSLSIEATNRQMARFATLFAFGEAVAVDWSATAFNSSLRKGVVQWADGEGEQHQLALLLGEPGHASVQLIRC